MPAHAKGTKQTVDFCYGLSAVACLLWLVCSTVTNITTMTKPLELFCMIVHYQAGQACLHICQVGVSIRP